MTHQEEHKKNGTSLWVGIGAIVLVILLLAWLTMADFSGDTDVAAFISPFVSLS